MLFKYILYLAFTGLVLSEGYGKNPVIAKEKGYEVHKKYSSYGDKHGYHSDPYDTKHGAVHGYERHYVRKYDDSYGGEPHYYEGYPRDRYDTYDPYYNYYPKDQYYNGDDYFRKGKEVVYHKQYNKNYHNGGKYYTEPYHNSYHSGSYDNGHNGGYVVYKQKVLEPALTYEDNYKPRTHYISSSRGQLRGYEAAEARNAVRSYLPHH